MDTLAVQKHREWRGKVETKVKCPVTTEEELALAYTPGVAEACMEIYREPSQSFELTGRANAVAVITDGTAILGLGNIGPEAGMPVMEGKCALFKTFGNVDAVPICLRTTDTEEIIRTVKCLEGSFGGINLEDISAPRCFEIETRLKNEMTIPVFHDDQHGTAIVVAAALINAVKVVGKKLQNVTVVINGAGAAGISVGKFLLKLGVADVIMVDKCGILARGEDYQNQAHVQIAQITNKNNLKGSLADAMKGSDVFVGVSVGNLVDEAMVESMAKNAIVFACANPVPEISPERALKGGAAVVGTGSSKYPNQINNLLVFPGVFRGALDAKTAKITDQMMMAAAYGIANSVTDNQLSATYVLPKAIDRRAHEAVAKAVKEAALSDENFEQRR